MKIEKNKNIVAAAVGFFLIIIIAAITFYRSQQPKDSKATDGSVKNSASQNPAKQPYELTSTELADKIKSQPSLIVIDVRTPDEFQKEHILGSKNIPLENIESAIATLRKDGQYVIVDSGAASGLSLVTDFFPKNGFRSAFYLDGGFSDWKSQNEPTISFGDSQSFVDQSKVRYLKSNQLKDMLATEKNLTIIDLRSSEKFKEGHLPGAENIFIDDIENRRSQLPFGKKIILYDRDGLWAFQGAVRLFDMGFFNVFCLSDGLDGWQKNKYPLTK